MMGYGRYEDVVNVLDQAVSRGDFLVGQSFTAANVYVGSHLSFDRDELQEAAKAALAFSGAMSATANTPRS
jgi:glutathione S-transferase